MLIRPNCESVLRLLTNIGGDINIPDIFVKTSSFQEILKELPAVKLGFNCVGGDSAIEIARTLAPGGTRVTYGGMSKRPFTVPFDVITNNQISLKGFWMAKWHSENSEAAKNEMITNIANLIRNQELSFFYELHDFDDFHYALKKATEPFQFRKVVLNMDFPDRFKEHDSLDSEAYYHFEAPVV